MKYDIVPPLLKTTYGRAAYARRAVGIAVEYALMHEKGDPMTPRALRSYFDLLWEKKWEYRDEIDGGILPPDYLPAMELRREMDLMARYGRLHPSARDEIGAFVQLIPALIQELDPLLENPQYRLEIEQPQHNKPWTDSYSQSIPSSTDWYCPAMSRLYVKEYRKPEYEIIGQNVSATLWMGSNSGIPMGSIGKTGVLATNGSRLKDDQVEAMTLNDSRIAASTVVGGDRRVISTEIKLLKGPRNPVPPTEP